MIQLNGESEALLVSAEGPVHFPAGLIANTVLLGCLMYFSSCSSFSACRARVTGVGLVPASTGGRGGGSVGRAGQVEPVPKNASGDSFLIPFPGATGVGNGGGHTSGSAIFRSGAFRTGNMADASSECEGSADCSGSGSTSCLAIAGTLGLDASPLAPAAWRGIVV